MKRRTAHVVDVDDDVVSVKTTIVVVVFPLNEKCRQDTEEKDARIAVDVSR